MSNKINLQLGDIIQIYASSNNEINNKIFIIDYIDQSKIKIKNDIIDYQLNVDEDGNLKDESIESIDLLSRAENKSYAKQNNLLPNTWIDIYFNGDVPQCFTGLITSLEEDLIEIKLHPSNDLIYIDFAYEGIPSNIPIEKINIRPPPESADEKCLEEKTDTVKEDTVKKDTVKEDTEEDIITEAIETPIPNIKKTIKEMILSGDQIIIGDKLETINQIVEVSENERRYSIESQATDLLDEILSTIPNAERTDKVLSNIHTMIQRYTELREQYSEFDENGNVVKPTTKGPNYKPLVKNLTELNKNLYWILLIANNKKKLYDVDYNDSYYDVDPLQLTETLIDINDIYKSYKSNVDSYDTYFKKLNPYLTPFEETKELLIEKQVNDNFNVAIDNLEDIYSSIAVGSDIKRKRFFITKYNLGLTKLVIKDKKGSKIFTEIKKLTNNDIVNIKSIMTLPLPIINYSFIQLPGTNILNKSNLNLHTLQYWRFLNKQTNFNKVIVNNFDKELDSGFDYTKKITNFILNETIDEENKYEKFLNTVIPKSRKIFEKNKKNIKEIYSIYSIVKTFEPYLVYLDDISFKLYEELIVLIESEIKNYRNNLRINRDEVFFKYNEKITPLSMYSSTTPSILYEILKTNKGLENDVFNEYKIDYKRNSEIFWSNSEILTKMLEVDLTRLYLTAISDISTDLLMPFDYNILLNEEYNKFNENLKQNKEKNDCESYVLSKKYLSLDTLSEDNKKEIYFDNEYDTTVYDIIDEYKKEKNEMSDTDFKLFLVDKLMNNIGLSKEKAIYEAESMINKKRKVIDGQYAVLKLNNESEEEIKYLYYKRNQDVWERDESIPDNINSSNNNFFCNIQEKCYKPVTKTNSDCASFPLASDLAHKSIISNIYDEFEDTYIPNKNQLTIKIKEEYNLDLSNIYRYFLIHNYEFYKYNNYQLSIIKNFDLPEIIVSPYKKILDKILSEQDFVKKQKLIISFVQKYTRELNPNLDKGNCNECKGNCEYWLYCIDTNTKILPTFVYRLACAFFEKEDYALELDIICDEQGTLSEDKDKWVDKHSGWDIKYVKLSTDQGYESGFKLITHDVLKKTDLSDDLLNRKDAIENPIAIIIENVVKTYSRYLGIIMDKYKEFIISNTLSMLNEIVDDEQTYNIKAENYLNQKGKKLPSYKDHFNQILLYLTSGYVLVRLETSIPSVQTNKTFPGCKKSFEGYPLFGDEDLSGLNYIACIAHKIKSSIEPWNTIRKLKEVSISQKIKTFLDSIILKQTNVITLLEEKRKYLQNVDINEYPIELGYKQWINFLPPLQKITNGTPNNISSSFKKDFVDSIKKGTKKQIEDINVINSKIIYFSIAIQELIQNVVEKEKPLLNANGVPFTQNSCCNTGEINTLKYFTEKETNILNYNIIVSDLRNILFDYNNLVYAPYLLDPINTKFKYPELENIYSEYTIYLAIITFCNFNSDIPVSDELIKYCLNKPDDYDENESIENKIKLLKRNGGNYNQQTMTQLLNIVNKNHILNLDLVNDTASLIQKLRNLLTYSKDRDTILDNRFIDLFSNVLDTYSIDTPTDDSNDLRELKNFLYEKVDLCKKNINTFIKQFGKLSNRKFQKLIDFFNNISKFSQDNNDDDNEDTEIFFKEINYLYNSIFYITSVFPNIILNSVDYENVKIPRHWGLSERHKKDIKNVISENYVLFKAFYNDSQVKSFLNDIQNKCTILKLFSNITPKLVDIEKNDGTIIKPILDKRAIKLLYEFYFFTCLCYYISLSNDKNFTSNTKLPSDTSVSDIMDLYRQDNDGETIDIDEFEGSLMLGKEKIAKILISYYEILNNTKSDINYTVKEIYEKVNRSKDKEKDNITKKLGDLTIEEREIENLFKKHKLERWDKGLQRGLVEYVAKTYDEEKSEEEKLQVLERKAQEQNVDVSEVEHEERVTREIEADEFDLSDQPEDDDYNEDQGEEYAIEYEEPDN